MDGLSKRGRLLAVARAFPQRRSRPTDFGLRQQSAPHPESKRLRHCGRAVAGADLAVPGDRNPPCRRD